MATRRAVLEIPVCDGRGRPLLDVGGRRHNVTLQCTLEDALKVVGELHAAGLDVMLKHPRHGGGADALLWVDDQGFTRCVTPP